MKVDTKTITCLRCGHEWTPRKSEVRSCPKCHSIYFDKPRKEKLNENKEGINSKKT